MKNVAVLLPVVFVIGGITGYYGPAEELRKKKNEIREGVSAAKVERREHGFGSFAKMVNIPDAAGTRSGKPQKPPAPEADREQKPPETSGSGAVAGDGESEGERSKAKTGFDSSDLRARIEEAADLWRVRSEIAVSAAVEKLELGNDGEKAFRAVIDSMNARLKSSLQIVADEIAASETMTPELGVRLMGDLSVSVAEAYDAVGEIAGGELRGEVSKLQMIDFVDPSVAEPLIAVQGKLEGLQK